LKGYLAGRPSLRRAYLLIDSRHGVKPVDHEIMALLDSAAVSFQVVLTKTDKLKPGGLSRVADQVAADLARHPATYPEMIATSSQKGGGIADLRAAICSISAV
ncbi:MAG: YihA family ribosome biogenesis GTP-binding protein, partial [Pseudomonadota bacterium]